MFIKTSLFITLYYIILLFIFFCNNSSTTCTTCVRIGGTGDCMFCTYSYAMRCHHHHHQSHHEVQPAQPWLHIPSITIKNIAFELQNYSKVHVKQCKTTLKSLQDTNLTTKIDIKATKGQYASVANTALIIQMHTHFLKYCGSFGLRYTTVTVCSRLFAVCATRMP